MPKPQGNLTPAQFEILESLWQAEPEGLTVAELWRRVQLQRPVGRTTVLNQVDRLQKRGWLRGRGGSGTARFVTTVSREDVDHGLATGFLQDFFAGRQLQAFSSLLGSGELDRDELRDLRRLVNRAIRESEQGEGEGS